MSSLIFRSSQSLIPYVPHLLSLSNFVWMLRKNEKRSSRGVMVVELGGASAMLGIIGRV